MNAARLDAYLLVTHGSRDPRPHAATEQLSRLVVLELEAVSRAEVAASVAIAPEGAPKVRCSVGCVGTAVLECHPLPLHQQIQQFATRAWLQGYRRVMIVPLFLLPGVHVMEDIPSEVAIARQHLEVEMPLQIAPHLGSHSQIVSLVEQLLVQAGPGARVLLAHGSRRPNGNDAVEAIAHAIGAVSAYWTISPDLETQVTRLVQQGHHQITVMPYFLFEGGTTDAIAQQLQALRQQLPQVQIALASPLGASPHLSRLIVEQLAHADALQVSD